jgi:hypothetical protein
MIASALEEGPNSFPKYGILYHNWESLNTVDVDIEMEIEIKDYSGEGDLETGERERMERMKRERERVARCGFDVSFSPKAEKMPLPSCADNNEESAPSAVHSIFAYLQNHA